MRLVRPSLDRHQRLRAVFDEVLLMDPSARDAHLDLACAGDDACFDRMSSAYWPPIGRQTRFSNIR